MNAAALIAANTARHTVDGYTAAHEVMAAHAKTIESLCSDLNEWSGAGQKPQTGCGFATLPWGESEALVEFEWEGASGDGWNEPRVEASVNILGVLLNRVWVDAEDNVPAHILDQWRVKLHEDRAEAIERDADDRAEAKYRDRMECEA